MSKYSGIVAAIIVIVAAIFGLGWAAMHRYWRYNEPADRTDAPAAESGQGQYMREVRLRHQEDLATMTYGGKQALVQARREADAWDDQYSRGGESQV